MGQISAEMMSALDIIFCCIQNNSSFFGRMLIFGMMDSLQLQPVDGHPPLLSSQVTMCFSFLPLEHSVWAAKCPALQHLVQICHLNHSALTEEIRQEFFALIEKECMFVPNWDDP